MRKFNNPLEHVRIASPCKADWGQMIGTDRVRFCGLCNLNVYNLSSMKKVEAELLIAQTEGRLCVRFYRRSDGSILTKDCPVGLRAFRRRLTYLAKAASAMVLSFLAGLGVYKISEVRRTPSMGVIALSPGPVMGDMAVSPGLGTTSDIDVPDVTAQGQIVRRVEALGRISPVVIGKRHSTASPKSRRK